MLIDPIRIRFMSACSKKELREISELITKYLDASTAEDFLDTFSVDKLDFRTADEIISDLMEKIIGRRDMIFACDVFLNKYNSIPGLKDEVIKAAGEDDKVKVICKYKKQIMEEIDKKYNKK